MRKVRWTILLTLGSITGPAFSAMAQRPAGESRPESAPLRMEDRLAEIEERLLRLEKRLERVEGSGFASARADPSGNAAEPASTVAEKIEALDQKLRIAEQRRELRGQASPEKVNERPVLGAGSSGFFLKSSDDAFALTFHGQVQADGRFGRGVGSETFLVRRLRPILEGTLFRNFSFRFLPDFGNGATILYDAYIDVNVRPWLKLRAGKFKGPVGLEHLVLDSETVFVERALPTDLVPNRDVGVQLFGEPWGGALTYAGGIFNGVPDGSSVDLDSDTKKEFEGRIFAHPFHRTALEPLRGLGIGIAGTIGNKEGTVSAPGAAPYRSAAQQNFFRYRSDGTAAGTVMADGEHSRISPQAYYYWGPFGLLAEYVLSSQDVRRGNARGNLGNSAWQASASYVLTGEKVTYRSVTPADPFDPGRHHWGAIQLMARYGQLRVDRDAFPVFADPQSAAAGAKAWAVGLNWYLNRNLKLVLNYEQTDFAAAAGGRKKKDEKAFLQRFQVAF